MEPKTPPNSDQVYESPNGADEVHLRRHTKKVTFYLREPNAPESEDDAYVESTPSVKHSDCDSSIYEPLNDAPELPPRKQGKVDYFDEYCEENVYEHIPSEENSDCDSSIYKPLNDAPELSPRKQGKVDYFDEYCEQEVYEHIPSEEKNDCDSSIYEPLDDASELPQENYDVFDEFSNYDAFEENNEYDFCIYETYGHVVPKLPPTITQSKVNDFDENDDCCPSENNRDYDCCTNAIYEHVPPLRKQGEVDVNNQHIKASFRREEWRLSVEKSFDIPDRIASDDTLTSFSSSSASTLERPSSEEMQRISKLSSSPTSTNGSSCNMMQLQKGNSEDDAVVTESGDSVPDMASGYKRMPPEGKRDVYKSSSMDSDGKSSGIFSGSRSSSQLNPNSTTSLPSIEINGIESDAKKIRRNFPTIVEEIEPVVVLNQLYEEGNIDSDTMFAIQELPTRRERAIKTVLLVLTSDISCSAFFRICRNTYEHVFKNLDQSKPSSKVSTSLDGRFGIQFLISGAEQLIRLRNVIYKDFCIYCFEITKARILNFIHGIQSQVNSSVCINTLLYRLMAVDLVSPKDVLSVYKKSNVDKIKVLMSVATRMSQKTSPNNTGDFLWALFSPDTITSKDDWTRLDNILQSNTCQICREVINSLIHENVDMDRVTKETANNDVEEQRQITVLYHDLSNYKEGDDRVVLIKLETKDDKKVKEILTRKKNKLNERIEDIARLDDVIVGSVILKFIFKDRGSTTADEYCKIEKVLHAVLSEQEIRDYLESGDMEISVSVTDGNEDICDNGLLNQKLAIILNMTALLEELDAISFKQEFVDHGIMSKEQFECQFKVRELGRKARASLLLKYVLINDAKVMDVFFEVIRSSYNVLEQTLLRRKFIGCDETEKKQFAFTSRKAVQHNEIENNSSITKDNMTGAQTENIERCTQIVAQHCSGQNLIKKRDMERINFVNGLDDKNSNNDVPASNDDQNLKYDPPLTSVVENVEDNLHCRDNRDNAGHISEAFSYPSSSGPKAMPLSRGNNTNHKPQMQSLCSGMKALFVNPVSSTQSSKSEFGSSGPMALPLLSHIMADKSPQLSSDLSESNMNSSGPMGMLPSSSSVSDESSLFAPDLPAIGLGMSLPSCNATSQSSTSYFPSSGPTGQRPQFAPDLAASGLGMLLPNSDATSQNSTSHFPAHDPPSQSSKFSSDLSLSGPREIILGHNSQSSNSQPPSDLLRRSSAENVASGPLKESNVGTNDGPTSSGPRKMILGRNSQHSNSQPPSDLLPRSSVDNLVSGACKETSVGTSNATLIHYREGMKHMQVQEAPGCGNKTVHSTNVKFINVLNGLNLEIIATLSPLATDEQTE